MKFLLFLTLTSYLPLWSSALQQLATIPETPSTVIDILGKAHYRTKQVYDNNDATKKLYHSLDTDPRHYEENVSSMHDILKLLQDGANSQTFLKDSTLSMALEKTSVNPMAHFYWTKATKWWTEDTATRSFPNNKHLQIFGLLLAYNAQAIANLSFTEEAQQRIAYHACTILANCSDTLTKEQSKTLQYIITILPQAIMPLEDLSEWCVTSAIKNYNYDIAQQLLAKCPAAAPLPLVINCALGVFYQLETNKKHNVTYPLMQQRSTNAQLAMLAVLAAHHHACIDAYGERSIFNRLTPDEQKQVMLYKSKYQKNTLGRVVELDESSDV